MQIQNGRRTVLAIAMLAVVAGCGGREEAPAIDTMAAAPPPPEPAAVVSVDLGNQIGPDRRVTAPMTTFARRDTIYASVTTTGAGDNVSLAAKWSYQDGQQVDSTSMTMSLNEGEVHEFHIAKATPWPAGRYNVVILLNGVATMTREFEIR